MKLLLRAIRNIERRCLFRLQSLEMHSNCAGRKRRR